MTARLLHRFGFIRKWVSLVITGGCLLFTAQLKADVINYYIEEESLKQYNKQILQMALNNAGLSHLKLNALTTKVSREQAFIRMESGEIDVMWLNTSRELEDRFIPVRIPILKGLMSYRTLMIRQGNERRFAEIESFDEFKQLKAGVGRFWTTTKVFKSQGINSVMTTKASNLYHMLEGGRFDYIPRGVMEISPELVKYSYLPLSMESTLLLRLPTAVYPFVSKNKPVLAKQIEQGLFKAIESGEFDTHFKKTALYQDTLNIVSQQQWQVITINNPLLPEVTPLDDSKLWVDFSQYLKNK